MTTRIGSFLFLILIASTAAAQAQSFDFGAHFAGARWSEFDGTDFGVGGRLSWKPRPVIGIEGEFNWYPSDFPGETFAFSGRRVEGLAAVTAGPRLDRIRPFMRFGAGFLRSSPAPEPFACIAIFPPPLNCLLAAGETMPSLELGVGLEYSVTPRTFVRLDGGIRTQKYPGPSFTEDFEVKDEGFWGKAFKFTFGGGVRF